MNAFTKASPDDVGQALTGGAAGYFAAMRILRGLKLSEMVTKQQRNRCGRANHVLRSLLDFADTKTWIAYPSVERIAEETDLSRPTVRAALQDLVTWGLLTVEQQGGGRKATTRYRVNLLAFANGKGQSPCQFPEEERGKAGTGKGQAHDGKGQGQGVERGKARGSKGAKSLPRTSQLEPSNSEPPNSEPSNSNRLSSARARGGAAAPGERETVMTMTARERYFRELVWWSFPEDGRVARPRFEAAWARAVKIAPPDRIALGLAKKLASFTFSKTDNMIHIARWLSDQRWEDEIDLGEEDNTRFTTDPYHAYRYLAPADEEPLKGLRIAAWNEDQAEKQGTAA